MVDAVFVVIMLVIGLGAVMLLYCFTTRVMAEQEATMRQTDDLIDQNERKLRAMVERRATR
jgi:hypothetical protein